MRSFKSLSEREILALAISLEEEDARIYSDFADGLKEQYPSIAEQFRQMREQEDGHRHRLLTLYRARFGDHIPLIRRQDVKGFVQRRPVWLLRPLGLGVVRRQAATTEIETQRFAEALSDDGSLTGRGHPFLRGLVCGLMTTAGGIGHTLPYLIPNIHTATAVAIGVVVVELGVIAWVRNKFKDTPLPAAVFQVVI